MNDRIRVLLVDDDEDFRTSLAAELECRQFNVNVAESANSALKIFENNEIDIVLLDIRMPGIDGIELVKQIKEKEEAVEIIMLTGYGNVENAVKAMKAGACDFLSKPCQLSKVEVAIKNAHEKKVLKKQNFFLKHELERKERYPELVGDSARLNEILTIIDKVAPMDSTVLVLGESGVGKELVARSVHRNSTRASQPFIVMDCCSLNENLLQSELFGHEKGAYTGAVKFKHGLFEVADGGTLFIDEIGEISPQIQMGLLRVLETGSFRRLGGTKNVRVDVRIIAATNRDLSSAIKNGAFREDLFYRLNVVAINVPPLRERSEDIPLLVQHALQSSRIPGARRKEMSAESMEILMHYHWPGNIRELFNVLERAIILSDSDIIEPKNLPLPVMAQSKQVGQFDKEMSLSELEISYIEWILKKTGGNRKQAAEILKIDPKTLYRKLTERS